MPKNQFVFVTPGEGGKPDVADRHLIRSHCMRDRNKRDGSRRSIRQAKQKVKVLVNLDENAVRNNKESRSKNGNTPDNIEQQQQPRSETVVDVNMEEPLAVYAYIPRPLATDISLVRFAGELDHDSHDLLHKFLTFNGIKQTIYPIEHCIDFKRATDESFRWLFQDVAFLHSVLLGISAARDFAQHRPTAKLTYYHLRCTLGHLNDKLRDQDVYLEGSVVYTIMSLALTAGMLGEYDAAASHIGGLEKIMLLRGGLEYLRHNPKIFFKIDRLQISWSLSTGKQPHLFNPFPSWDSIFNRNLLPPMSDHATRLKSLDDINDPRLTTTFHDLHHLVRLVNEHHQNNTRFKGSMFQDALNSIQTRLILLQNTLDNVTAECLRLGMLAFLTTTFRIPGRNVSYRHLTEQLRNSCRAIEVSSPEMRLLMFWLLAVGAISVLDMDSEPWLREKWTLVVGEEPGLTWDEARRRLQGVMWINYIQDDVGKRAFEELMSWDAAAGFSSGLRIFLGSSYPDSQQQYMDTCSC